MCRLKKIEKELYMKFLIQRVSRASVTVDNKITGQIQKGFLVLIGISDEDSKDIADIMIKKMGFVFLKMRIIRRIFP